MSRVVRSGVSNATASFTTDLLHVRKLCHILVPLGVQMTGNEILSYMLSYDTVLANHYTDPTFCESLYVFYLQSTPFRLIDLLNLNIIISVVPVDIHRLSLVARVVGHNRQTVVRAIEMDLDRLTGQNLLREDHDAERVKQLGLDGAVERARAVCGRVADGDEVVLRLVVDCELNLAVIEPFLELPEPEVDNLEDVLA